MALRERYVLRTIALAGRGISVDVSGEPGSGRTHVLRVVRDHFVATYRDVLEVTGTAALKDVDLSGLAFAGVDVGSPAATVEALIARLGGGRGLVVVDDWDRLDHGSRMALRLVRDRAGVPIVASRLESAMTRRGAEDLQVARVCLDPFTTAELAFALRGRCGGEVNAATLAAIMNTCGGNIGVAMAIITDAEQDGRLSVRGGRVALEGPLWSDRLSATAERMLAALSPAEQDALEFVARFGPMALETAAKLLDPAALRSLERAGLITLGSRDGEPSIQVRRPAIIAHFLHRGIDASSLLFADAALATLAADAGEPVDPAPLPPDPSIIPRVRLALALDAWRRHRTRHVAAAVAESHLAMGDYAAAQRVLDEAADLPADAPARLHEERVRAAVLRGQGRSREAFQGMRARAGDDAVGLQLRARAAVLQCFTEGNAEEPLPAHEDADPAVAAELRRARGFVQYMRGEIAAVDAALPRLLADFPDDDAVACLACLVETAQGRTADAMRIADRRRVDLVLQAQVERMHDFAYLEVFAGVVGGHPERVGDAVCALRTAATPSRRAALLRGAAAALLAGAGDETLVPMRTDAIEEVAGVPGADAAWWTSAQLTLAGEPHRAAEVMTAYAEGLWQRGVRTHAVYALLYAAGLDPVPERLAVLRGWLTVVDGAGLRAQGAALEAIAMGDAGMLAAAAVELEEMGQQGRARTAWETLAQRATGAAAERARLEVARIAAGADATVSDTEDAMTPRERQIVRMSVSGMTQAEIASELVLSVRTVESHLHRAMRKVGPQLAHLIGTYTRMPRTAEARNEVRAEAE